MSTLDPAANRRDTRVLFTLTVFVSAFLLFLIQPLFGRKVLPLLGGAPGVWNTAMVFYQALLLIGYCYAHAARRLPPRVQFAVHAALLLLAALTLPIGTPQAYPQPDDAQPFFWLIGLFALSIGLPFLVVATHAPLLQRWFAGSRDPSAGNPYFLYAASNLGSMLALIAYPLLFEPLMPLADQALVWSGGFVLLAALVIACGWGLLRPGSATAITAAPDAPPVGWMRRLHWLLLAAVPSGLLLAVTTMITTDIMAMPLLWMIPLILYLLTFVIAFAERRWIGHARVIALTPAALMTAALFSMMGGSTLAVPLLGLSLVCFFVIALACHGELMATRPEPARLTEFYIWMSLGGVVGGLFTALVAPVAFDGVYEYPLLLLLAALVLPPSERARRITGDFLGRVPASLLDLLLPLVALALSWMIAAKTLQEDTDRLLGPQDAVFLALLLILTMMARGRRYRFAVHLLACALAFGGWMRVWVQDSVRLQERSFFGVYTVRDNKEMGIRLISHGTTTHGAQSLVPQWRREPLTYYAHDSGVGQVLLAAPRLYPSARIAAVGLGAGTVACYAAPGQRWAFYEIDPLVVRIARDPALFTYLSDCAPGARIVIGDARLTLARQPPGSIDVLVVDAFSSDAIPLHLITREALALYAARIQPGGIVLLHISNRHLDLEPVVARGARSLGLAARVRWSDPDRTIAARVPGLYLTPSRWIALARTPQSLERALAATPLGPVGWDALRSEPGTVWTDDYANLLLALKL